MDNAAVFNFDVEPFLNGMRKIEKSMNSIEDNTKKFGKTMTDSIGKAITGGIMKVSMLIASFKAAKAVLNDMPEVGQAFGIAKDIFMKNFTWPLRQQVMPLLQKMLDWTRDHRAMFVKWGEAVGNIFRTVVVVAKELWTVFKQLIDVVGNSFQKAFNTNFHSFDEFINVLSFKISAVVIYLGMLAKSLVTDFKPAFDWIIDMGKTIIDFFVSLAKSWGTANDQGKSFFTIVDKLKTTFELLANFVGNAVKGLSEGFLPAVKDAMTPIDNFVNSINELLKGLGFGDSDGIRGAFKAIGGILGTAFVGALSTVATSLDVIVSSLMTIAQLGDVLTDIFKGDWSKASKDFKAIGATWSSFGKRTAENFSAVGKGASTVGIHDGIVTKDGKVIKTDPDDNIFAVKDIAPQRKTPSQMPISMGPFYISVTEGNAEQAGRNFGTGLAYSFRNNVSSARLSEGN